MRLWHWWSWWTKPKPLKRLPNKVAMLYYKTSLGAGFVLWKSCVFRLPEKPMPAPCCGCV
jgi:hypothetical protein